MKVQIAIRDCSKQVEAGAEKATNTAKLLENQVKIVQGKNAELNKKQRM